MSEESGAASPPPAAPHGRPPIQSAVIRKSKPLSAIWLIPIIAALTGGFLAWKAINDQGPSVTILFDDAAGLAPEKTKIKYKEVDVGFVEDISITDDLNRVRVTASMVKEAAPHLTENTRFWVVRAQVNAGGVSGFDTLLGGVYIAVDLRDEGAPQREFEGLQNAPLVTSDDDGTAYTLRAESVGSLSVGAPVFYRSFQVGKLTAMSLDESGDSVTLQVFVDAPHDKRVNTASRFWNASGLDVVVNAEGVRIDTPSIVSMLVGGISFDDALGFSEAAPVTTDTLFTLHPNKEESQRQKYARRVRYVTYFDESVSGLSPGAPVEFRGIKIGRVIDFELTYDPDGAGVEIPVLLELEPDRVRSDSGAGRDIGRNMNELIEEGLRARLATANLITGALKIELDFMPDVEPTEAHAGSDYPEIPSAPDALNQITNSVTKTLAQLEQVPLGEIGRKIDHLLGELNGVSAQINRDVAPSLAATLDRLEKTLDSVDGVIGPDSTIKGELEALLLDLGEAARSARLITERLEQHPEDLLRGKSR